MVNIMENLIFNIVFMPLFGALLAFFLGRRINDRFAQVISSIFIIASFIFSLVLFKISVFDKVIFNVHLLDWINIGTFKASWSLYVDSVTAVMFIVVTSVSSVVHLYSIGYMEDDESIPRFMSYLSLFTFFMLLLVSANNILQLFVGWEGVGLCSYLLIGFWYKKSSANEAAMKAFLVNRVSDFAFILGIASLFLLCDNINYQDIFAQASALKTKMIEFWGVQYKAVDVVCLLLFIGAMGKSAQIGLHTWLPDAMEGPTPVSALIHAATMVTAGVFLVIRFSPIFELSSFILNLITYVGAFTAIFAATIALTQSDIKKIVAYSTCSQLGYMFFACGVGAYPVALFHLMTHAFFKALLFLGAGNVIYATHHQQDIFKMGGLSRQIPITYLLMLIGSLALAGIYPFAGYFSKDLILEVAFAKGTDAGIMAFSLGLLGAFFTAFYSWRLLLVVFQGKSEEEDAHAHEAPPIMIFPLFILAIGALLSGMLAIHLGFLTSEFWQNSLVFGDIIEKAHHLPWLVKYVALAASILGIATAYLFYVVNPEIPKIIKHSLYGLYLLLKNKYYFDEIYNFLLIRPFKMITNLSWQLADNKIIDGLGPNGTAWGAKKLSGLIAKGQSGYIYHYILVMILALVAVISWYVWFN